MNTTLLLLASIIRIVGTALTNPDLTGSDKTPVWAGYLNLASQLAQLGAGATDALSKLNDQLVIAVQAGRGLTAEELAAWKARDDVATHALQDWLTAHPKK